VRCTSPQTWAFAPCGTKLTKSKQYYSKELAPITIPCGKCISCRLINARNTAIRCVHEAQMHEKTCFITLTYSEENLKNSKLNYKDFQLFVKKLRSEIYDDYLKEIFPKISTQLERREHFKIQAKLSPGIQENLKRLGIAVYCAGEYGDRKKRPHWHALIFNWRPVDCVYLRTNESGDRIFKSKTLDRLWGKNDAEKKPNEIGNVTLKSAGYCARYAAKKLAHGKDGTHEYNPISRRSTKYAIGRKWIEKYWKDVFGLGYLVLPSGEKAGIPRYYEKWLKKYHPDRWKHYVTQVKPKILKEAQQKEDKLTLAERKDNFRRSAQKGLSMKPVKTHNQMRNEILEQKFNQLQKHLKDV